MYNNSHKLLTLFLFGLVMAGCKTTTSDDWLNKGQQLLGSLSHQSLDQTEIAAGLKEALHVGTTRMVNQVGRINGFNLDRAIHIPLPANLQKVQRSLAKIGLARYMDDLELRMNRAAEMAAAKAKQLFWNAIKQMSWQDVKSIYHGPEDAATQYFKKTMTPALKKMMRPVINKSLADSGVIRAYDKAMGKYKTIPFVPDVKADLGDYVLQKGIDGMFYYLAKEEAAIRQDPAKRTTELLRKVFSN